MPENFTSKADQPTTELFQQIMRALAAQGKTNITLKDLSAFDEIHVGGAAVSVMLLREIHLHPADEVLDIGCGLGGPARMLATHFACHVTGIDQQTEYINTAKALSQLVGLQDQTKFLQGTAMDLPFHHNTFNMVWTQHVQMNIAAKGKFYGEISRVLKPGGQFLYYDIFGEPSTAMHFPLPWADDESQHFLINHAEAKNTMNQAGLQVQQMHNHTKAGIAQLEKLVSKYHQSSQPFAGLDVVLGKTAPQRFKNLLDHLKEGNLEIYSGLCVKA